MLKKFLGVEKYRSSEIEKKNLVGITNGLAWTEVGGEITFYRSTSLDW